MATNQKYLYIKYYRHSTYAEADTPRLKLETMFIMNEMQCKTSFVSLIKRTTIHSNKLNERSTQNAIMHMLQYLFVLSSADTMNAREVANLTSTKVSQRQTAAWKTNYKSIQVHLLHFKEIVIQLMVSMRIFTCSTSRIFVYYEVFAVFVSSKRKLFQFIHICFQNRKFYINININIQYQK